MWLLTSTLSTYDITTDSVAMMKALKDHDIVYTK